MFLLDWLEPSAGTELDTAMDINNSYIFFEYSVCNFGGDQMNDAGIPFPLEESPADDPNALRDNLARDCCPGEGGTSTA